MDIPKYHYSDEFAHNFKGTLLYTLSLWKYYKDCGPQQTDDEEMSRTGHMHAYSAVLVHATGQRKYEGWKEVIEAMP